MSEEIKELAQNLLHILQHSLGLDEFGQGSQYRNHYCAGGDDVVLCRDLAGLGYMKERPATVISGDCPWFSVTPSGIDAVALFSPPPPPQKKRKQWHEYLDCDYADSFGEFLLGVMKPAFEHRGTWRTFEYRMYRCRYSRQHTEISGEWCTTMKEAKASYKAALKVHQAEAKALRMVRAA